VSTIHIPDDIEAAAVQLEGMGRIITAAEWERAAIVATYVQPGKGHGGRAETFDIERLESARVFARRGIHGLRSAGTVLIYVSNWLAVRSRPVPGDDVDMDGLPEWPGTTPVRAVPVSTPTPAPPPVVVEESQPAAPVQVSLQGSRRTGGPAEQSRPRVGGWNLTRSEKERIGPDIEDLYVNEGYSISEIQRAYGFKSNASVRAILNERGVMTNLGRSRGEDPPPVNWRGEPTMVVRSESSEPEPAPVTQIPHWRNSTHVNAMNHMAGVSRADNGLNYMAYLVRDALVAEDAEWLVETLAQVRFLSQRFADYVAIFEDPEFRQRCMTDPEVRDDWQAMIASENPER